MHLTLSLTVRVSLDFALKVVKQNEKLLAIEHEKHVICKEIYLVRKVITAPPSRYEPKGNPSKMSDRNCAFDSSLL
jgi:hypothetical protein